MSITGVKISSLGAVASLDGSELVPLVKAGVTQRGTSEQFVTLASGVIVPLATAAAIAAILPVTNANMASMAEATVKGRAAGGGAGTPEDLSQAQLTALVNPFTDALPGVAPASGGGTTNFLRADGTWAAAGGGGITTGDFEGTFTLNDFVSPVSAMETVFFQIVGNMVTLYLTADVSLNLGAANGGIFSLTGLPAPLLPDGSRSVPCIVEGDPFLAGENRMPGMAVVNPGIPGVSFYHATNIPISNDGTPFGDTFTQYALLRSGWSIEYPLVDAP